jgi:H+/Cl- antiporter ClcA
MHISEQHRPVSLAMLLATAMVTGAFAGLVAAVFIWLVERGAHLVWVDLPERVGVDAFGSWWLFAVPVVGGVLVGVAQRTLGDYPRPLDEAITTWKSGGRLDPAAAPKTACNALVALVAGGPVGFEAALTGILGGTASWIGDRIDVVGRAVRQAWGAETIDSLPRTAHQLPYWLAAASGLFAYRWLPFGAIDFGFRFDNTKGSIGVGEGLAVFAIGAAIVVPAAWAIVVVGWAEHATYFRRSPILLAVAGALVFALLAVPNKLVLFSGQEGFQQLPDASSAGLAYISVVKWLALVVALLAGWRGGPIFPTYTAAAALALLLNQVVDISPQLAMIAAIAAVSIVLTKGSLPMAFVLSLYPTPFSYGAAILLGCLGAALALTLARSLNLLPTPSSSA